MNLRDDDDGPAPVYCVSFTSTDVHPTAYDGNPKCTPAAGQWDNSWTKYVPSFCDSWFHSVTNDKSWIRVTPLWWNVTCSCSASQLDTHNARKNGCSDPYTYQLTKYLQFTQYLQSSSAGNYKMLVYYKGWALSTHVDTRTGSGADVSLIHVCSDESKGTNYSLLGNVSDGLSSLVPDIMANKMQNVASTAKYLLCMGDGQAIDLYVMDGSTPETMKKRVPTSGKNTYTEIILYILILQSCFFYFIHAN